MLTPPPVPEHFYIRGRAAMCAGEGARARCPPGTAPVCGREVARAEHIWLSLHSERIICRKWAEHLLICMHRGLD